MARTIRVTVGSGTVPATPAPLATTTTLTTTTTRRTQG